MLGRTGLVAILVLGVIGGLVWLGSRSGEAPDRTEDARRPEAPARNEPEPTGGREIRGQVRRDGAPEAGARIEAVFLAPAGAIESRRDLLFRRPGAGRRHRTVSDATGAFRLDDLEPGAYQISAAAADGATAARLIPPRESAASDPVVLDLIPGSATLRGRAVYADGAPFRGEVLLVVSTLAGTATRTDETGAFRFEGRPPGAVRLSVFLTDDRRVLGPKITLPHEDEVVFVVDEGLVERRGTVVAAATGDPLAGAVVLATSGRELAALERARTDANGAFRVVLVAGKGEIEVRADGFTSKQARVEPGEDPLEIRLDGLASVTGRVLSDADDSPLAGIPVQLSAHRSTHKTRSDAEGRYAFRDVEAGEHRLAAWGAGRVPQSLGTDSRNGWKALRITLEPGVTAERDLRVVPAGGLRGRVLTAGGEPVAGAEVRISRQRFRDLTGTVERTGKDGAFAFDSLLPEPTTVTARHPDFPPGESGPTALVSGETAEIEIRLSEGRSILVTVIDRETTEPIAGATIRWSVEVTRGSWRGEGSRRTTDASGRAEIGPVPEKRIRVRIERDGYFRDRQGTILEGPEHTTIALDRERMLGGTILLPDGGPAVNARVSASQSRDPFGRSATADAHGAFRLDGLGPGPVGLSATLRRGPDAFLGEMDTEAGRVDIVLRLESEESRRPPGAVVIRVTGPDGAPVPLADLAPYHFGRTSAGTSGTIVVEGQAVLAQWGRPDEQRWLEVFRARDARDRGLPFGAVLIGPVSRDRREVAVALPPEKIIEGVVVGISGDRVPEVRLTAVPVHAKLAELFPTDLPVMPHARATTDAEGRFRLGGLGDFLYTVKLAVPSRFAPVEPRAIGAGATGLTLVLLAAAEARVTVLDPTGKPVSGATVSVAEWIIEGQRRNRHDRFSGRTDVSGGVRVTGLDPRRQYALTARGPDHRLDLLPAQVEPWEPRDTRVDLGRGLVLSGRVVDPGGRPMPGAHVYWSSLADDPSRSWTGIRAGADGTFRIGRLATGRIALVAVPDGGTFVPDLPETTVDAADERVRLVADPGVELIVRISNPAPRGWSRATLHLEGEQSYRLVQFRGGEGGFVGLPPGKKGTLLVRSGDRCLLRRDVESDGPPLDLELAPARTITGRVISTGGVAGVSIRVELLKNLPAHGTLRADGSFEIPGLPPGTFEVVATRYRAGGPVEARATAEAGGSVTLRFD